MQSVLRQDLLAPQSREHLAHGLHNMLAARQSKPDEAPDATPTVQPNAVAAPADVASLSPTAQSVADLRAVIAQLNAARAPAEVKDALAAVKQLVNNNTNATMVGDAIDELNNMADAVLAAIDENPDALGGGFAFRFQADFSQQQIDTESYYSNVTSFSFRFSYRDADTLMQADMGFSESLEATEQGMRYQSSESVSVSLVTFNVNLATNPALEAFVNLTQSLTGLDLTDTMNGIAAAQQPQIPSLGGGYVALDFLERLKLQIEQLNARTRDNRQMIELLERLMPAEASDAA